MVRKLNNNNNNKENHKIAKKIYIYIYIYANVTSFGHLIIIKMLM